MTSAPPRALRCPPPSKVILSDSSANGWGGVVRDTDLTAGGLFTESEALLHINAKELLGAYFSLKAFCKTEYNTHVQLLVDNVTAVSYVREMGGAHSSVCNKIPCQIWEWAIQHNIWLSIAHVPGFSSIDADRESRHFHKETEWQLKSAVFQHVVTHFDYTVEVDLVASRTNCQIARVMSWPSDPNPVAVDALAVDWTSLNFWCFPQFSIILRVLHKIQLDKATGLLVVPRWPTQPWYPILMKHLVDHPRVLPRRLKLLQLPEKPQECHPLQGKLQLMIGKLSGNHSRIKAYQESLPTLSSLPGDQLPPDSTAVTSPNGPHTVVNGRVIQFIQPFLPS